MFCLFWGVRACLPLFFSARPNLNGDFALEVLGIWEADGRSSLQPRGGVDLWIGVGWCLRGSLGFVAGRYVLIGGIEVGCGVSSMIRAWGV